MLTKFVGTKQALLLGVPIEGVKDCKTKGAVWSFRGAIQTIYWPVRVCFGCSSVTSLQVLSLAHLQPPAHQSRCSWHGGSITQHGQEDGELLLVLLEAPEN